MIVGEKIGLYKLTDIKKFDKFSEIYWSVTPETALDWYDHPLAFTFENSEQLFLIWWYKNIKELGHEWLAISTTSDKIEQLKNNIITCRQIFLEAEKIYALMTKRGGLEKAYEVNFSDIEDGVPDEGVYFTYE